MLQDYEQTQNNPYKPVNKNTRFSSSNKEEIFMYLSIIVALLAYRFGINWLMWVFGVKAVVEALASFSLAYREYDQEEEDED